MRNFNKVVFAFLLPALLFGSFSCKRKTKKEVTKSYPAVGTTSPVNKKITILREIPHPGEHNYTQGFEIHDGILFESTGLDKQSSLKKIDLQTGKLLQIRELEDMFAEGITILNGSLTLLTYKRGIALDVDIENFKENAIVFTYKSEGWGLTNDGTHLIMSDGSDKLYFYDSKTYKITRTLSVRYENSPVYYLNELEFVNGIVYANVYGEDFILGIDPKTGLVVEDIDASQAVCAQMVKTNPENVLNGIAWNPETRTFFITGKRCPNIYEVLFE